jgi:opacity protein-like surface antigen
MKSRWIFIVLASLLSCPALAWADEYVTEIDLTTFGESRPKEKPSVWEDIHLQAVGLCDDGADRRFYISGMLGPSFAEVTASNPPESITSHGTVLAAGGAMGMAFERTNGRLRVETEGMGRSTYFGPFESVAPGLSIGLLAASNWSVMENVWRDFMLTDRFGIYGGGGIGAGGYRVGVGAKGLGVDTSFYVPKALSAFAWQAGGGWIYQVTDRLTFDVGYRYFQINPIAIEDGTAGFAASELMFSLRLYEPFRRWTH